MSDTLETFLVKIVHVLDQQGKAAVLKAIVDVEKAIKGVGVEEQRQTRQSRELSRERQREAQQQAAAIARAFNQEFTRFAGSASRYIGAAVAAFASVRAFKTVVDDLDALDRTVRRTNASAVNVKALQNAWEDLGGTAGGATGALEGFSEALRRSRGVLANLQRWGVTEITDPVKQLEQSAAIIRDLVKRSGIDAAIQWGENNGMVEELVRLLASPEFERTLQKHRDILAKHGVDYVKLLAQNRAMLAEWRVLGTQVEQMQLALMGPLIRAGNIILRDLNKSIGDGSSGIKKNLDSLSSTAEKWAVENSKFITDWLAQLLDPENTTKRQMFIDFFDDVKKVGGDLATVLEGLADSVRTLRDMWDWNHGTPIWNASPDWSPIPGVSRMRSGTRDPFEEAQDEARRKARDVLGRPRDPFEEAQDEARRRARDVLREPGVNDDEAKRRREQATEATRKNTEATQENTREMRESGQVASRGFIGRVLGFFGIGRASAEGGGGMGPAGGSWLNPIGGGGGGGGGGGIAGGMGGIGPAGRGKGGLPSGPGGGSGPGNLGGISGSGGSVGSLISRGEGGYGSYNRGMAGDAGGRKIDFSQMTVGELMRRQALPRGDPNRIFAFGKYQVIPATMLGAAKALGLRPDQKVTPALQEQIFRDYLISQKQPAVRAYITGSGSLTAAQSALAGEFASIADPSTGRSRYGHVGGNRASISAAQAASALQSEREKYQANLRAGMSPTEAWRNLSGTPSLLSGNQGSGRGPTVDASPVESGRAPNVVESNVENAQARRLPITKELRGILQEAGAATGLRADVYSGGQLSHGGPRAGSHRHDVDSGGLGSADLKLYDAKTGDLLDSRNPEDRARMARYVQETVARGATGIGHGLGYMGPNALHIGGGAPNVWGEGGRSANAPEWLRSAFDAARQGGRPAPEPNIDMLRSGLKSRLPLTGAPPSLNVPAMKGGSLTSGPANDNGRDIEAKYVNNTTIKTEDAPSGNNARNSEMPVGLMQSSLKGAVR
jgi:hypothetical protein